MRKILVLLDDKIREYAMCKLIDSLKRENIQVKIKESGCIILEDDTLISIKYYNETRLSDLLRSKYNIKEREVYYCGIKYRTLEEQTIKNNFLSDYLNQQVLSIYNLESLVNIIKSKKKYPNIDNFWLSDLVLFQVRKVSLAYSLDKKNVFLSQEEAKEYLKNYMNEIINKTHEEIVSHKKSIELKEHCINEISNKLKELE